MSKTDSIVQGMQSVQSTGMYTARLNAFTENAKAFEAYDFSKGFESEAAKKQKDAATFTEVALGFKAVPNSNTLYNKHHALLSAKYDALFLDSNITAMAATPEGRAAFSRAVEQLNQETKGYENIYSSTFGDPSTADGKGSTYSDHVYRRDNGGGDDVFFQREGFKIDKTSKNFEDRLVALDNSSGILSGSITFDPKTGVWGGYDANDPLLSMDANVALQHFSYKTDQAIFTPPSNAVAAAGVYGTMVAMPSDESMLDYAKTQIARAPLDAVAYWKGLPENFAHADKEVQVVYQELIGSTSLNQATDAFAQAMVDEVKARKKKEEEDEAKSKKAAQGGGRGGGGGGGGSGVKFNKSVAANGFDITNANRFIIDNKTASAKQIVKNAKTGKIQLAYVSDEGSTLEYMDITDIDKLNKLFPGIKAKYNELLGTTTTTTSGKTPTGAIARSTESKQ